jgi:hypothetical protein
MIVAFVDYNGFVLGWYERLAMGTPKIREAKISLGLDRMDRLSRPLFGRGFICDYKGSTVIYDRL